MIPAAIITPVALGWLRSLGERADYFTTEFGISLLVLANILFFHPLDLAERVLDAQA